MTSATPDPDWSARRSDARRNHERIVTAAIEVFAELGQDATVPEVAARAGVGKATVYRSYPTKADLVAAVAAYQSDWYERRLEQALEQDDAFAGLCDLLHDISARLASDRLFVEVLSHDDFRRRREERDSAMERLVDAAREQGALRADATHRDVQVLMGGVSLMLNRRGITDPAGWRRYTDLVLAALRP
jgi:AcrR family transcriptional regulator